MKAINVLESAFHITSMKQHEDKKRIEADPSLAAKIIAKNMAAMFRKTKEDKAKKEAPKVLTGIDALAHMKEGVDVKQKEMPREN